jgi:hypothetical protein
MAKSSYPDLSEINYKPGGDPTYRRAAVLNVA